MSNQQLYQAIHYELVASAKAVQLAHSIDPEYKVGSMILAVTIYPLTPNPDDIIEVMELDNEVYLFSDVQALGAYPYYAKRVFEEKGVQLEISDFQSGGVQVGHLGLGDLSNLCFGDGADLGLVGNTGALLQTNCLHDEHGGRRSLGDEGEAAVCIDGDDNGDLVALHVLGPCIEFLDECCDIHTVLTQSRADRGRSGCLSGVDLKFDNASYFLCHE